MILFYFFSFHIFIGGHTRGALSMELLTVSSATPSLGFEDPGGSWAHWACFHRLRPAVGSSKLDHGDVLGVGAEGM